MTDVASFRSTVYRKLLMAGSGLLLVGFLIAHMLGNLKAFQGPAKFDAYSHFLREVGYPALGHGELLWIARVVLLAAVFLHIASAISLARLNRVARPVRYKKWRGDTSSYASRTMLWGGVIIALYVIYHILHLTTGQLHPNFTPSPFANLVSGFRVVPVALVYIAAQIVLGFHLYHGIWSALRTLGAENPRGEAIRRGASAAVAVAISIGFISVPVGVLTGIIR